MDKGKCISRFIIMIFLISTPLIVSSQSFQEGTHYSVIENNSLSNSAQVVEYFSFSCPGCYAIEPYIKALRKASPSHKFERIHMPFGGRKAKLAQKVFVLMKLLNANQYKDAIFDRIHSARNTFDNEEEIIKYYISLNYEREKVEQTLHSFSADTMIRSMNQQGIKNQIKSVPTIIVNGQFKVNIRAIKSKNHLVELIEFLHERSRL